MTEQQILDRALDALGFDPDDESIEAERAATWVAATFDDDAHWLEISEPSRIRRAYDRYRRTVYGNQ